VSSLRGARIRTVPLLRSFTTEEATPAVLGDIRRLVDLAFAGDFSDDDWEHTLGGRHVVVADDGTVIAHAAVIPRRIEVAGRAFRTGYVEAVATDPGFRGAGHGTAVMTEASRIVCNGFEMGALSTGSPGFYARLGWELWRGSVYVRHGAELVRTPEEDGDVMVLRFGPSAEADLAATIACEARTGDDS
jgi:aminoglycoside 2'-N-acetyltransferase I